MSQISAEPGENREPAAPGPDPAPSSGALAPSALPPIADGVVHRLDPRVVPFDRLVGLIVTGCISLALLITVSVVIANGTVRGWRSAAVLGSVIMVSALLAWATYIWPPIDYRRVSYRVDADGIEIHWGVFWRSVISVPRSRVQHIDVSQGPLQRSYGLGTLRIYTAGTEHAQVDLPGLDHSRALRIRDALLPKQDDDAV
jgi:membrane protein YdbS with pleckstrin-like domain